jgi:hypothetical protein
MTRKVYKIWYLDNFDDGYINKIGRFIVKFMIQKMHWSCGEIMIRDGDTYDK